MRATNHISRAGLHNNVDLPHRLRVRVEQLLGVGYCRGLALAELRHLVEVNASAMVLAIVLFRRLDRTIDIDYRPEDEGLPTLVWADHRRADLMATLGVVEADP